MRFSANKLYLVLLFAVTASLIATLYSRNKYKALFEERDDILMCDAMRDLDLSELKDFSDAREELLNRACRTAQILSGEPTHPGVITLLDRVIRLERQRGMDPVFLNDVAQKLKSDGSFDSRSPFKTWTER